jgi:hypothetical protein
MSSKNTKLAQPNRHPIALSQHPVRFHLSYCISARIHTDGENLAKNPPCAMEIATRGNKQEQPDVSQPSSQQPDQKARAKREQLRLYNKAYYHQHKQEKSERNRVYHQVHRERLNAKRRTRYQRNPAPFRTAIRQWVIKHRDRRRASQKEWYQKHRVRVLAKHREYYQTHREEAKLRDKQYYATHRMTVRIRQRRYYERKKAEKVGAERDGL